MRLKILILVVVYEGVIKETETMMSKNRLSNEIKYNELDEHALVTDNDVFPFVVAILKKSNYLMSGALIDNSWVLTAADSFFLLREATRTIRVRLGSINYRKGGTILPVKYIVMHPNFDDQRPSYDLALIRLPEPVRDTPTLKPIKLQRTLKEVDATHFIVPSWPNPSMFSDSEQLKSIELVKRRRLLSVTHLHPTDIEECDEELSGMGVNDTEAMMCLDTAAMIDPCSRDVGAPVVLNGLLWGIISSWGPVNCEENNPGPTFVNLVAAPNISTWIHAIQRGHKWQTSLPDVSQAIAEDETDEDYSSQNIILPV